MRDRAIKILIMLNKIPRPGTRNPDEFFSKGFYIFPTLSSIVAYIDGFSSFEKEIKAKKEKWILRKSVESSYNRTLNQLLGSKLIDIRKFGNRRMYLILEKGREVAKEEQEKKVAEIEEKQSFINEWSSYIAKEDWTIFQKYVVTSHFLDS